MTDEPSPYLIAHKVRGEPAFDVAIQMECPQCQGTTCPECDAGGFWWIIPTSGHRAYPYAEFEFASLSLPPMPTMPPSLPDHYIQPLTGCRAAVLEQPAFITTLLSRKPAAAARVTLNRRGF